MVCRVVGIVSLMALGAAGACDRSVSEADREAILRWLTCEECERGERDSVVAIGRRAIPLLIQPFDTTTRKGRALVQALEASIQASLSPLPADSATAAAVRFYLGNAVAVTQIRAATSLSGLHAAEEIRWILQQQATIGLRPGLRPDVVRALEVALDYAVPDSLPVPEVLLVPPPSP